MTHVINTENLTKHYGEVQAAEAINLDINEGEIYGFLGLNGAGKTTTIRMMLGMIRPTSGAAYLFGQKVDAGTRNLWNRVGHMVEIPYSYPELTLLENLRIFYRLRLLKNQSLLTEVVEMLNLGPYVHVRVKHLSTGNAQRLGIAKALIHKPRLLILDEPANGLDPAGIVQIREILTDMATNQGVTVFISSHILGEITRFASSIGIIHEGKMIRENDIHHLDKSRHRTIHVSTLENGKAQKILAIQNYSPTTLPDGSIELDNETAILHPEKISYLLTNHGLPPTKIVMVEEDLESYFLRIIQTNGKQS